MVETTSILNEILSQKLPIHDIDETECNSDYEAVSQWPNYSNKQQVILVHDFEGNLLYKCNSVKEVSIWFYQKKFSGKFWDGKVRFSTEN